MCQCRRHRGLILGSRRFPTNGNDNPLLYSSLGILWTEEPGGLESLGSWRVGQNWGHACMQTHTHTHTHTHTYSWQGWTCDHILTKGKIIRKTKIYCTLKVNGKFCFMNLMVSSKVSIELLFSYLIFSTLSYLSKQI